MTENTCQLCGGPPESHRLDGHCRIYVQARGIVAQPHPPTVQWSQLPAWDEASPITKEQFDAVQRWINAKRKP